MTNYTDLLRGNAAFPPSADNALGAWGGTVTRTLASKLEESVSIRDFGGVAGQNSSTAIQAAIAAVAGRGGGTVVVPGASAPYLVNVPVRLLDGVYLVGETPSTSRLQSVDSLGAAPLVNDDNINGNVGIGLVNIGVDANKAGRGAEDFYPTVGLTKCSDVFISNIHVSGGSRSVPSENSSGEGLQFTYCDGATVIGGLFFDNDYDGIAVRSSKNVNIIGSRFRDNGRSGIQFKHQNINEAPTEDCSAVGCIVHHSTGVTGSGAPYVSAFGFHRALRCVAVGGVAYGTHCLVDMLEGANDCVVANSVGRIRAGFAGLYLWNYNNATTNRNRISSSKIIGLTGNNGRMLLLANAQDTLIENCNFQRGGGQGTWTIEETAPSSGNSLHFNSVGNNITETLLDTIGGSTKIFDENGAPYFRNRRGTVFPLSGFEPSLLVEDSFDAESNAAPVGWTAGWVTSDVTWQEVTGGFLRAAVSVAGRHLITADAANATLNSEALVKVRSSANLAGAVYPRILFRGSGAAGSESGYAVGLAGVSLFSISRYANGTVSAVGSAVPIGWSVDQFYWMRARIDGSRISAKAWAFGSLEPDDWMIDLFGETGVASAGLTGAFAFSEGNHDFDYFAIATDGSRVEVPV